MSERPELMIRGKPVEYWTSLKPEEVLEQMSGLTPLERMLVLRLRCEANDKAACEGYYFAVKSEEPARPGLMYRWREEGNMVAGEVLVRLGELDPEEFKQKTGYEVKPLLKRREGGK